jgi:hypothetical protein
MPATISVPHHKHECSLRSIDADDIALLEAGISFHLDASTIHSSDYSHTTRTSSSSSSNSSRSSYSRASRSRLVPSALSYDDHRDATNHNPHRTMTKHMTHDVLLRDSEHHANDSTTSSQSQYDSCYSQPSLDGNDSFDGNHPRYLSRRQNEDDNDYTNDEETMTDAVSSTSGSLFSSTTTDQEGWNSTASSSSQTGYYRPRHYPRKKHGKHHHPTSNNNTNRRPDGIQVVMFPRPPQNFIVIVHRRFQRILWNVPNNLR